MSDDLISRKAVIEVVDRHTREDGTLDEDISVILEEVETAFDKEKVIEEIREKVSDCYLEYCGKYNNCLQCRADEAVKIVEKGGLN